MKYALLCAFLLLFATPILAQTSNLDELPLPVLRQRLAVSKEDTTKVQLQLALGHLMFSKPTRGEKETDSAIKFAGQAAVLSRRLNYHFGIINAMLLRAETFNHQNEGKKGLKIAEKALTFSRTHKNSDGEARSYHLIAQYYSTSNPVELATRIAYLNKAIAIFRKNGNVLWLSFLLKTNADLLFQAERITEGLRLLFEALNLGNGVSRRTVEGIYWNIGRISFNLGDYPNALKYNLLASETAKEVNDTTMQVGVINHLIAATYIKMQDYRRAIPYSKKVIDMAKRYHDEGFVRSESFALALAYTRTDQLSKAIAILNEMKSQGGGFLHQVSITIEFLNHLTYAKRFKQAAQYVRELESLLPKIYPENTKELMNVYNSLATYYSETGQLKQAYRYTELYGTIAHKLNYATGIRTAEYRYYQLVSLKGDLKSAMEHFVKEKQIKDSIDSVAKAFQLSLLHIENEALEKNRHIESLTRNAQINDSKLKRNQLIQQVTFGGFTMLLIITGLIYSRYRLKQRSHKLLTRQKSEIDQKNADLQQLVADKIGLLEDKDKLLVEKDLLLKEVNHRVKNNLQIVMNLLQSQSIYMSNEGAQQAILESQNRVQSIALIHDQLYKTEHISEINLSSYIKELIRSLNGSLNQSINNIDIDWDIDDINIDVSQAIPVGIILNETVTNALKYAFPNQQAGKIKVLVKRIETWIEMQISDNGIGLPEDFNILSTSSLGLTLLKGLTGQLKGTFSIKNNKGLTITIKFPVEIPAIEAQMVDSL